MLRRCNEASQSDYVEFSNFNVHLMDRKMARFCGTTDTLPKKSVTSDSNFFRVTFHSNHIWDSTGFKASYQFRRLKGLNRSFIESVVYCNCIWAAGMGSDCFHCHYFLFLFCHYFFAPPAQSLQAKIGYCKQNERLQ